MHKKTSNIAIIILAAGASKRMQTSKQLLKWGDSTLLGCTIETALKLKIENTYVVLGANYQLIGESISKFNIAILNNENWESGLGNSIAFAVNHILKSNNKTDAILFMLADQPFIDEHFLNELINQFKADNDNIIATSYGKDKYGVPVIFDKIYFKALSKLNDDNGAKHLLKQHKSKVETLIPPVKNVDLDFMEDYIKLHNYKLKNP